MLYSHYTHSYPFDRLKVYLAKITGPDPQYVFHRNFLKRTIYGAGLDKMHEFSIGGHGVYELSSKHFSRETGKPYNVELKYFVYFRRVFYEIERQDVLFCVFNLDLQYKSRTAKLLSVS